MKRHAAAEKKKKVHHDRRRVLLLQLRGEAGRGDATREWSDVRHEQPAVADTSAGVSEEPGAPMMTVRNVVCTVLGLGGLGRGGERRRK